MALVSSWDNLTAMLTVLNHHCSQLGLRINCKKTKILVICQQLETVALCDSNVPIDVVDTSQYLGSNVSDD